MKKVLMTASVASMIDSFNRNNIRILMEQGYEVHVACNFKNGNSTSQELVGRFYNDLMDMGIKLYQIDIPRRITAVKQIFSSYYQMKKICSENNYQIVHCHTPIGGVIARLACRKLRKNGMKVIYTAHGFHFFKGASIKNWLLFYPIEKYCARYTDCLITINKEDYRIARKFNVKKLEYVPGVGIQSKGIAKTDFSRTTKRKELGLTDDDFVLINVGELSKRKNQEVIIRTLAYIKKESVKLLICGIGGLEPYYTELINELHLKDRVILTGYRSDIKDLLAISDCFVFPSLQEGLPVALMEAMAAGLPVICSKIRGNIDLIDNNEGGYLFKPDSITDFTEGIIKLENDTALCKKMSEYNRTSIEKFDISLINLKMDEIYRNL